MSIQHRCRMQCRMGAGRVPDGCRMIQHRCWIIRHRCWMDIFAHNFLNNGLILINFFLFESSWSPLCNGTLVLDPAPSSTQHYPAPSTYNPACACASVLLALASDGTCPAPPSTQHYPAPSSTQHYPAPSTYNPACACASYLLVLVFCSRLHHLAPVRHHSAPNTIQHHLAPNIIQYHPLIILLALVTCSC